MIFREVGFKLFNQPIRVILLHYGNTRVRCRVSKCSVEKSLRTKIVSEHVLQGHSHLSLKYN